MPLDKRLISYRRKQENHVDTYTLSKIDKISVKCIKILVNARASMRYTADSSTAAAVTSKRRYTVLLTNYWSTIAISLRFWVHLFSVTAVPVRAPGFPKPPPSPPWEIQSLRAIPDTAAKPRIYRPTFWDNLAAFEEYKLHTVEIKRMRKMGSLILFFGRNRPSLYGILVSFS